MFEKLELLAPDAIIGIMALFREDQAPNKVDLSVGVYQDEKEAYTRTHRPGKVYEPNSAAGKQYDDYYAIFKRIYPGLKDISHSIFETFRT